MLGIAEKLLRDCRVDPLGTVKTAAQITDVIFDEIKNPLFRHDCQNEFSTFDRSCGAVVSVVRLRSAADVILLRQNNRNDKLLERLHVHMVHLSRLRMTF